MSYQEDKLTNIASAIRYLTETTAPLNALGFHADILTYKNKLNNYFPVGAKIMKGGTGGTSPSGVLGGTWQDKSELMNNAPIKRIYYWLRTA